MASQPYSVMFTHATFMSQVIAASVVTKGNTHRLALAHKVAVKLSDYDWSPNPRIPSKTARRSADSTA